MNGTLPQPARDIALLLARVILGVVMFAHGWQKLVINGMSKTQDMFDAFGVPLAIASASFAAFAELVGGALLVLGALTPAVVVAHLIIMIGAYAFVHASKGIFAVDGGWELVGVIAAGDLFLGACGAGRYSLDRLISTRMRRRSTITTDSPTESAGAASDRAALAGAGTPATPTPAAGQPASGGATASDPMKSKAARAAKVAKAAAARARKGADSGEPEPVTSAIPALSGSGFSAQSSSPVFPAEPGRSSGTDQSGTRSRRIPRPIMPLQGRNDLPARRPDPRPLDRTDDTSGR